MLQPSTAIDGPNLKTFWYWITEREAIRNRRITGQPRPWSTDPIFNKYKFCNVFRDTDRTSKWLVDNILEPHWDEAPELVLFNIFLFRAFNWVPTTEAIGGWCDNWSMENTLKILESRVSMGEKLTTGAYMIRGQAGFSKHVSICRTLDHIWKELATTCKEATSSRTLQQAYNALANKFFGWGEFTLYQVVLDLTYTPILERPMDINTWCLFGPGAKRGLRLIWPQLKNEEFLSAGIWLLSQASQSAPWPINKRLNLQDIEFSLCELSKYVKIRDGGAGELYRGEAGI